MPGRRRSRGRRSSSRRRTMFFHPTYSRYERIVRIDTPTAARQSADQLESEFKSAKTRDKKVRVKRVTVLAANRSEAIRQKKDLSTKERDQFREIEKIYRNAADRMDLPEK